MMTDINNKVKNDAAEPCAATSTAIPQPVVPRVPGETPRAFGAFVAWFQLGPGRSHQQVADKLGECLPTVKNWASKYNWSDRLLALDSGVLQQEVAATVERRKQQAADWAERLNEFREQEWDAAQKLLSAARCFLESFSDADLQKMTLAQVSRAIRVSSQMGRAALFGLELPPSADSAISPVQQQMLDALRRLSEFSPGPSAAPPPQASPLPVRSSAEAPPTHSFIE
jgi:hypothetical protein